MIQDTWKLFPRLIEQRINGLLEEAEPSNTKAYQLYKTCKSENLWRNSFELFNVHLSDYFSLPKSERAKSYFDKFLDRPMNRSIYDSFSLSFRTAHINFEALSQTASWSHNVLKINSSGAEEIISSHVFFETLHRITNPPLLEKESDIDFEDFCIAWKKTVFTIFGSKFNSDMEELLKEVRWLNKLQKNPELRLEKFKLKPSIYLTQTEIIWTAEVQEAVFENRKAPDFPLSRGPEKEKLVFLERTVRLYNLSINSPLPKLIGHSESIRTTVLDQCGWLLRECAA